MSVDLSRLVDLVDGFPRQTIAVVGDLVADEYVSGEITRVSREAPVLILRHQQTQVVPGGAGNAAINLADLGARVLPVGVVGNDAAGEVLLACFRAKSVTTGGILKLKGWTTTTKTRFLAGWPHTARQQVLRLDRQPGQPLPGATVAALLSRARRFARRAAAVLVSDYGCGAVSPALVRRLGARCVTLDSRYALLDYSGVTAATPNEAELEALYHTRIGADAGRLEQLGRRAVRTMRLQALLVTRGKDGMTLFEPRRAPQHISAHGSDLAVDVTGAGDTVIAVFTLALAAGASFLEAAHLANYAGGIVVMKRGTATLLRAELLRAIQEDAAAGASPSPPR